MTDNLRDLHTTHGARFGGLDGVADDGLVLDYGDFPAEVQAIRTGVGIYESIGSGVILVRGADAAAFLNGITTNDVQRLAVGQVQPNLLCGNKGKILYPIELVRLQPEQFLVVSLPGALDGVAGHLDGYLIREDAEMGRIPFARLELLGPESEAALASLGLSASGPIGSYGEAPLLTLKYPLGSGPTAIPRVLVLLPEVLAPAWVEALMAAAPEARLVGIDAHEEARIAAGVPRYGRDYDRDHLPAEAALYSHVSFNKGCYVGQEVHARLHHRGHVNRKLVAVRLPAALAGTVQPGTDLYAGHNPDGRLTSLTRLDDADGMRRGIALVRYSHLQTGDPLAAEPGATAEIRLGSLSTDLGASSGS